VLSKPPFEYAAAIAEHSAGLARAAEGNLDATVEHCPGWTVADLVDHVTQVHWFWATIVEDRLDAPPAEERRPTRAEPDQLIPAFRTGANRLVKALRATDPAEPVYTWAAAQKDVAFVARHQVQEAAVHHSDAAHAAGLPLAIATLVAVDSVEEFLTFSVSSDADPVEPAMPPLDGTFALCCQDVATCWTISDGVAPGAVAWSRGARAKVPRVHATASDLLLWLYGRIELDIGEVPPDVLSRFGALSFTD
jgi:uncharacterized protein (TIGR03083 family)